MEDLCTFFKTPHTNIFDMYAKFYSILDLTFEEGLHTAFGSPIGKSSLHTLPPSCTCANFGKSYLAKLGKRSCGGKSIQVAGTTSANLGTTNDNPNEDKEVPEMAMLAIDDESYDSCAS